MLRIHVVDITAALVLVPFFWTISVVNGQSTPRHYCLVQPDIVAIQRDPLTGDYVKIGSYQATEKEDEDNGIYRRLQEDPTHRRYLTNQHISTEQQQQSYTERIPVSNRHRRIHQNTLDSSNNNNSIVSGEGIIHVRECVCTPLGMQVPSTVYCPLFTSTCVSRSRYVNGTIHEEGATLGCMSMHSTSREFSQIAAVVVAVWFAILLGCMLITRSGRHLFGFLFSLCIPRYNKLVARWIERRNPQLAHEMIVNYIMVQRRLHQQQMEREESSLLLVGETTASQIRPSIRTNLTGTAGTQRDTEAATNQAKPSRLVLKTRIYKSQEVFAPHVAAAAAASSAAEEGQTSSLEVPPTEASNTNDTSRDDSQVSFTNRSHASSGDDKDDDDDYVPECVICFVPLQNGDKVGDLHCGHTLHSDCLKCWLKRHNSCPLCKAVEIATPGYDENNDDDDGEEQELNHNDAE